MMVRLLVMAVLACGLACGTTLHAEEPTPGKQVDQVFQSSGPGREKLGYLLYLPDKYSKPTGPVENVPPENRLPLLLFLHGSGERGTDINKVKIHGPPKLIAQGKSFPFIVVSPQCPEGVFWNERLLLSLLDDLQSKLPVDRDRVYVTGLSMGGFGTWALLGSAPERFAAALPICGHGSPWMVEPASKVPVWVVVGDRDSRVLYGNSIAMVASLQHLNADVKYTVYAGVGHDSWTQTYATPEFYDWLLRHRLSDRSAKP